MMQTSQDIQENQPQRLWEHVLGSANFGQILAKAKALVHLQKQFQQALGSELSDQCQIAEFQAGCLTLQVNNASWATRIRYSATQFVETLRKYPEFSHLKTIHCQVRPSSDMQPEVHLPAPRIPSAQNTQLIRDMASTIKNEELKNAWLRLAAHFSST